MGQPRRADLPASKLSPAYQSGREFDDELVDQLEVLPEFVAACGFANAKAPGYEADDFLAAAVAKEERRGPVLVATGDRDAYQLASAKTTILQPIKAGEMARIGPAEVRERYGVEPNQVPDFIALRGDASDKIPGAKGVGPKTAAGLLVKYGSLEKLLAAGRFAGQADELRLYRSIATMDRCCSPSLPQEPGTNVGQGVRAGSPMGTEPFGGPARCPSSIASLRKSPFYIASKDSGVMQWQEAMDYAAHSNASVPSREELNQMYHARNEGALKGTFNTTGSTTPAGWYWSSSQNYGGNIAWAQRFSGGFQDLNLKIAASSLRCVRG